MLTGHAEVFSLSGLMTTLWTTNWLTASILESFTSDMIFTVTYLCIAQSHRHEVGYVQGVSKKTTLMLHTITSMYINRFW